MTTRARKKYVKANEVLGQSSFPDIIEAIREDLEITKVAMAKKLQVTKSYYSDFVAGRTVVSVAKAATWAKYLDYPEKVFVKYALDDLLDRSSLKYKVDLNECG